MTTAELRFMETVPAMLKRISNSAAKIAEELGRANRLEAFRLRKEHSSAENAPAIDAIMEVSEP